MLTTKDTELEEAVSRTMLKRAFIFTCSYKTAWRQYMSNAEKQNLSLEHIYNYMNHSRHISRSKEGVKMLLKLQHYFFGKGANKPFCMWDRLGNLTQDIRSLINER